MTAEQRAEYCLEKLGIHYRPNKVGEYQKRIIADQIKEAIDEARAEGRDEEAIRCYEHCEVAYAHGFSDARERAAKIAEKEIVTVFDISRTVQKIRALQPSEK